ncbi:MAG: ADP-glyceromanno-heptose 6-epimerase [Planctomycetes bacterium]|nr:ADP-glyceromanno-heptose 6-epimerase [Planctomycetota bacterium]
MIVITGGAGFIGSNLVAGLEAAGYRELVICDRFGSDERWRNVAKREIADIISPDRLLDFLDGHRDRLEAIVHMGAISATTECDVDAIIENNIRLTLDIFHWAKRTEVRLIYASSAATYGDGSQGFVDDNSIEALNALRPLNAYGWSKAMVDRRISRLMADGGPTPLWAGLKFFNAYGPNEYHKGDMRSVVAKIYPVAAAGGAATLFESHHPDFEHGGQSRDFVYVKDCVKVVLWLLENPLVSGVYNLGTGESRSFKDLANAVYRALGSEPRIQYVPTPEEIRDKYQYFTQADMSRLRAAGFDQEFTSLEDGVKDYVQNYLHTPDPYL